jgi:hypothetical protein
MESPMFERYTEKARRVIFFGRYEASEYGSPVIDTEHLLLGLLREDPSLGRWYPKTNADALRQRIDDQLLKHTKISTSVDMPLSKAAKDVLRRAADEADDLGSRNIGTQHLFLGLIGEKDSLSSQLLLEGGADATAIREYLAEEGGHPKPWSYHRSSVGDHQFRELTGETVEIHGAHWTADYVRDAIQRCRAYNWHWRKRAWKPRDVVISHKDGTCSFDLSLAQDSDHFSQVKEGWKKDHCFVCRWELFESNDEHGLGYSNGRDWLCVECYERFWQDPEASDSLPEIT